MHLKDLIIAVDAVSQHLSANDFTTEANELQGLLSIAVQANEDSPAALKAIHDRCHIKWLGDLPIRELTVNEWLNLLENVKTAAL